MSSRKLSGGGATASSKARKICQVKYAFDSEHAFTVNEYTVEDVFNILRCAAYCRIRIVIQSHKSVNIKIFNRIGNTIIHLVAVSALLRVKNRYLLVRHKELIHTVVGAVALSFEGNQVHIALFKPIKRSGNFLLVSCYHRVIFFALASECSYLLFAISVIPAKQNFLKPCGMEIITLTQTVDDVVKRIGIFLAYCFEQRRFIVTQTICEIPRQYSEH